MTPPGDAALRLGLGYVNGVRSAEIDAIVAERDRGGPFSSAADLAARCASRRETLELLAWAGACDALCPDGGRREALWKLGVAVPGAPLADGDVQLALPLDADAPALRALTPWERMVADYGSTKVTLHEHPLELMRPTLDTGMVTSADLPRLRHGRNVHVAGLVVARQRPATANGVTFMLLEDEHGTINLIVPPPVYERCRLAVRAEPLVTCRGRLEQREGNINILASRIDRLDRPDLPKADVTHIEPARTWSSEAGEDVGQLRAVAPAGHSFGRRGR